NLAVEKKQHFEKVHSDLSSIEYGETSEHVENVQEALAFYDYYEGEIDGIYGTMTETALQKAEQDNALPERIQTEQQRASNEEGTEQDEEISEEAVSLEVENDSTDVIGHAKELIGTPYEWGGTSPSGFDCSGFIQFVYEKEDKTLPRTVREVWNYGSLVDEPSIGDLVFFETYQAGPSHMGIYLGNGDFIHAGSSEGVTISNINAEYWHQRYIGAKNID